MAVKANKKAKISGKASVKASIVSKAKAINAKSIGTKAAKSGSEKTMMTKSAKAGSKVSSMSADAKKGMIPTLSASPMMSSQASAQSSPGTEAAAAPMTTKNFRNHPDMENFFRFVYENDLRIEALEIIDQILSQRQEKAFGKKQSLPQA